MIYVLILVKFTDEKKVVTDGPTDGPTDRPTDRWTHPHIEMLGRI